MKYIIFDFDGTIADSMPLVIDIARSLLPEVDLSDKRVQNLRNLSPRDIVRAAKLPYIKIPRLLVKGKRQLAKRLDEIPIVHGMDTTIADLHRAGYTLLVVSSNSEVNIRLFLDKYSIKQYFKAIYGNVGLFSKAQTLRKVVHWQRIKSADVLYVGDEVRDIEAAKRTDIRSAAVTWGFNGRHILKKYEPTFLVEKPAQLIQLIKERHDE